MNHGAGRWVHIVLTDPISGERKRRNLSTSRVVLAAYHQLSRNDVTSATLWQRLALSLSHSVCMHIHTYIVILQFNESVCLKSEVTRNIRTFRWLFHSCMFYYIFLWDSIWLKKDNNYIKREKYGGEGVATCAHLSHPRQIPMVYPTPVFFHLCYVFVLTL